MIGRITGLLVESTPTMALVDVSGVGYEIEVPLSTFYQFGELNDRVTLHIQMIVREDAQLLYGFYTLTERDLFRSLIKVNGVGPKLAIAILSGVDTQSFSKLILNNDVKALVALPGVGKKTAERLVVEMKDRLPQIVDASSPLPLLTPDNLSDAEAALIGLGYKPQDASRALALIENPDDSVESLIKQGLRTLS